MGFDLVKDRLSREWSTFSHFGEPSLDMAGMVLCTVNGVFWMPTKPTILKLQFLYFSGPWVARWWAHALLGDEESSATRSPRPRGVLGHEDRLGRPSGQAWLSGGV